MAKIAPKVAFLLHVPRIISFLQVAESIRGSSSALGTRRARARHLFLTIPHPCLFFPHLTKQFGVPSRRV